MLVKLEHVKKHYGKFELNCSLDLKEGQVTGLIGQNGAGKSTAFKVILGLVKPDSGTVKVLGKDLQDMPAAAKGRIGTVLADSSFGSHMTVTQAGAILSAAYTEVSKEEFLARCEKHGLPLNKKIKELSTGMKAKLKVLAALSHDTDLLLLDEPTAGLDVVARDEILDMLRDYMETEGRGILISSHISSDLEGLCDDVYMIHQGQILFHEDTDLILSDYGILKMKKEQYASIDKEHLMCVKEESYGYCCLTAKRLYYQENYPFVVAEKCGIDQVETMLIGGKRK